MKMRIAKIQPIKVAAGILDDGTIVEKERVVVICSEEFLVRGQAYDQRFSMTVSFIPFNPAIYKVGQEIHVPVVKFDSETRVRKDTHAYEKV